MNFIKNPLSNLFKVTAILIALLFSNYFTQAQSNPWPVPKDGANLRNPEPHDAASIKNGKTIYIAYCSPCHGDKGKGDGPASAALNPKPADHTSAAIQAESDAALFYKISEGRNPMPGFKEKLKANDRWALINYIRTLSKKSK